MVEQLVCLDIEEHKYEFVYFARHATYIYQENYFLKE